MSAPEEHNGMLDWYICDKFSTELTSYKRHNVVLTCVGCRVKVRHCSQLQKTDPFLHSHNILFIFSELMEQVMKENHKSLSMLSSISLHISTLQQI